MKRKVALVLGAGVLALAAASPAGAINDAVTGAGKCANSDSAVGTPGGGPNPGLPHTDGRVSPPVSDNNPGLGSTGANGNTDPPCNTSP